MKKLTAKQMYHEDEDFPGDPEEFFFYVGQGAKVRKESKTADKMAMRVQDDNPDKELGDALLSENGLLASGSMANPVGVSDEGAKNLLDTMATEGVKKTKAPKPKDDQEEKEPVVPKESWESFGGQLDSWGPASAFLLV